MKQADSVVKTNTDVSVQSDQYPACLQFPVQMKNMFNSNPVFISEVGEAFLFLMLTNVLFSLKVCVRETFFFFLLGKGKTLVITKR